MENSVSVSLLRFQITKLGYQFTNLDLLTKALTHSINEGENNNNFYVQNRTNQRLAVVGERVLKLVVSEYVIRTSKDVREDQGDWTVRKGTLLNDKTAVGKELLEDEINQGIKSGISIVRINKGNWSNPCFQVPYPRFINALFGAIFLDSCDNFHYGTEQCFQVFLKLWQKQISEDAIAIEQIKEYFPPPSNPINNFWQKKGLQKISFIKSLRNTLGIEKLENRHHYLEAIIHVSFYNDLDTTKPKNKYSRKPHYERLEFLGDAILDTVLSEYFWRNYSTFDFTRLSNKISILAENVYQNRIYEKLDLDNVVKREEFDVWNGQSDIVEAIIGAIFIDQGYDAAKAFVLQHWNLTIVPESCITAIPITIEETVNYKFDDQDALNTVLEGCSRWTDKEKQDEMRVDFETWQEMGIEDIWLSATKYAFQVSELDAQAEEIYRKINKLCSDKTLKKILQDIRLDKFIEFKPKDDDECQFTFYKHRFFALLGAGMEEGADSDELFYRTWNRYLEKVPERSFLDCFLPGSELEYSLFKLQMSISTSKSNKLVQKIEKALNYKFKNTALVEQAVFPAELHKRCKNPSFGDIKRFRVIGTLASKIAFDVDNQSGLPSEITNIKYILKSISKQLPIQFLRWYWKTHQKKQNVVITLAILGAVYLDAQFYSDLDWTDVFHEIHEKASLAAQEEELRKQRAIAESKKIIEAVKPKPTVVVAPKVNQYTYECLDTTTISSQYVPVNNSQTTTNVKNFATKPQNPLVNPPIRYEPAPSRTTSVPHYIPTQRLEPFVYKRVTSDAESWMSSSKSTYSPSKALESPIRVMPSSSRTVDRSSFSFQFENTTKQTIYLPKLEKPADSNKYIKFQNLPMDNTSHGIYQRNATQPERRRQTEDINTACGQTSSKITYSPSFSNTVYSSRVPQDHAGVPVYHFTSSAKLLQQNKFKETSRSSAAEQFVANSTNRSGLRPRSTVNLSTPPVISQIRSSPNETSRNFSGGNATSTQYSQYNYSHRPETGGILKTLETIFGVICDGVVFLVALGISIILILVFLGCVSVMFRVLFIGAKM